MVACRSSSYEILESVKASKVFVWFSSFLLFQHINGITNPINTSIGNEIPKIIYSTMRKSPLLLDLSGGHCGTWNWEAPQIAPFDMKEWFVKFTKGLPFGISPLISLKETLKYLRYKRASNDLRIAPLKLL